MNTRHAQTRAQQRGIPPLVDELLDRYGREQHDGHGAVILYFDHASVRTMKRELGHRPVAKLLGEWRSAYKVRSTADGATITVGHRTQRVWRV